ncbi:MAG: sorbitol dehydrogenase [Ruminococcaceae bacterium]|nr:sorbitol dehydrogenase [Oscillospiraceae bacterium]
MKAFAVYKDGKCGIVDVPVPAYGEYEALVKMISCGVCNGTDMKIIHGKFKGIDEYPALLGHEGVGEVVELGSKVKHLKIGDRVLLPFIGDVPDGYSSAWGTYAEYNVVTDAQSMLDDGLEPDDFAYAQQKIPSSIDPVDAAMIVTFREVYSTMGIFGFEGGKSLAILGLGPVGLSFVKFAKLIGMGPVIAMDIDDEKLALAKELGADYTLNTKGVLIPEAVRQVIPDGVDFALDAVGVTSFIGDGMAIIKPDAKVCVYGISEKMTAPLDWSQNPYNWTLQFNQFPQKKLEGACHERIIKWIEEGELDPSFFVSHRIPFCEMGRAFEMIEAKEKMLKMVVQF